MSFRSTLGELQKHKYPSFSQKSKEVKSINMWFRSKLWLPFYFFAAVLQPDDVPNLLAKEELNLLARIMGSMKTVPVHTTEGSFRLNLFASDREEEEAWVLFWSPSLQRSPFLLRDLCVAEQGNFWRSSGLWRHQHSSHAGGFSLTETQHTRYS